MSMLVECPHCATRVLPMAGRMCPACRKNVDTEPAPVPTPEQVAPAAAYWLASDQIRQGTAPAKVQETLTARGLDARSAATVVDRVKQVEASATQAAARRNLMWGAMLCFVGIVVTVITYRMATNWGGGTYVVAWGAVLFGAVRFVRGLFQLAST